MLNIQTNIPLAPFTSFNIGGPAKVFIEVASKEDLIEALSYAEEVEEQVFILGGGSNILISDEGFSGVVIKLADKKCELENGTYINCGAAVTLAEVVSMATENELTGLEWAAGIPGTLGGAIRGNAGAFTGSISDSVRKVFCVSKKEKTVKEFSPQECGFAYRSSLFKSDPDLVIISCLLELGKGSKKEIQTQVKEIVRKRMEKQPREASVGSFFKNPIVSPEKDKEVIRRFEGDMGLKMKDNKLPAGWLIEAAGMKGKSIGGAEISVKHGNFIINKGNARAEDVIILSSMVTQKVRNRFGIQLEPEVQLVGF